MRQLALILFLFAATFVATAAETNYVCVVCGKGPLTGRIWLHQRGAVCNECYQLPNRCSLCGLPIGKDFAKTPDGRFLCAFDKATAVLDAAEAREVFTDARRELLGLFGRSFALNNPEVTVNLFDVDYWSENGRSDGLHKFGFSSTRKSARGEATHLVVMLSGRSRAELAATAAHEYTHLWINENRPADHAIDADTQEAICELVAYKLVAARGQTDLQQLILANPYTHGEITKLIALEKENGIAYVFNWVKSGTTTRLESRTSALAAPLTRGTFTTTNTPAALPEMLKLGGLMLDGQDRQAVVGGVSFSVGETKWVKLRSRSVRLHCREITRTGVVLELDGQREPVTLKIGEEKYVP